MGGMIRLGLLLEDIYVEMLDDVDVWLWGGFLIG